MVSPRHQQTSLIPALDSTVGLIGLLLSSRFLPPNASMQRSYIIQAATAVVTYRLGLIWANDYGPPPYDCPLEHLPGNVDFLSQRILSACLCFSSVDPVLGLDPFVGEPLPRLLRICYPFLALAKSAHLSLHSFLPLVSAVFLTISARTKTAVRP